MNLQAIGSSLGVWSMKKTQDFKHQIPWSQYLQILDSDDRNNVQSICDRLKRLSKERNLPLAVVAVGSVLNPHNGALGESYQDVDLLLVPLLNSDLRRFEGVIKRFVKKQPETERQSAGLGRVLRRSSWRRSLKVASAGLPVRLQRLTYWYQISIFWNLTFPGGKPVQVFVRTMEHRQTLEDMVSIEGSNADQQIFSRLVLTH